MSVPRVVIEKIEAEAGRLQARLADESCQSEDQWWGEVDDAVASILTICRQVLSASTKKA